MLFLVTNRSDYDISGIHCLAFVDISIPDIIAGLIASKFSRDFWAVASEYGRLVCELMRTGLAQSSAPAQRPAKAITCITHCNENEEQTQKHGNRCQLMLVIEANARQSHTGPCEVDVAEVRSHTQQVNNE